MTTIAQVKKLVQPLLARHSDLALVGRWIYVKPVRHFARTILIDRMLDPDRFNPRWAVVHLFEARTFFPLDWGEYVDNEASLRPQIWRASDPETASAMISQIEGKVLPVLRAMTTLDDYLAFVSRHFFRHKLLEWPDAKLIVDVALGDLDSARAICKEKIQEWSTDHPGYDDDARAHFARLRALCAALAANDRACLAKLLHEWEALTVKNLRIEHLWQPTPFPLELA
jgi:hypothetical protein